MATKIKPVETAAAAKEKLMEKIATAIEGIKVSAPHVKYAYFNDQGEYHFHKRPGFAKFSVYEDEPEVEKEEEILPPPPPPTAEKTKNSNLEF